MTEPSDPQPPEPQPPKPLLAGPPATQLDALLPLVDRHLTFVIRRERWLGDGADDFAQWVRLRFVENHETWLAAYKGRAQLATYIAVIVSNLVRDYRNHHLGKWRPSAAAMRAGDVGKRLDELLHRDRRSLEEAIEILRRNEGVHLSAEALRDLAASLPPHFPRRFTDQVPDTPTERESADHRVAADARARDARHLDRTLTDAIHALPPDDCLLLRLRYVEGLQIAQIARHLKTPQRPLYRRFEGLNAVLRRRLLAAGLTKQVVADILGSALSSAALTGSTDPPPHDSGQERHSP